MKSILAIWISVNLAMGCQSTKTELSAKSEVQDDIPTSVHQAGALKVESIIYRPSHLPLSTFFKRLAKGQVSDAFNEIDWNGEEANHNGKMLDILIDQGYIPALVTVTNTSKQPIYLEPLKLNIRSPYQTGNAIPNDELPTKFESINWQGIGNNTGKTLVSVAKVALVVGAIILIVRESRHSPIARGALDFMPHFRMGQVLVGTGNEIGILCEGGIPVDTNGDPVSNRVARSHASLCFKQAAAIDVDVSSKGSDSTTVETDLKYESSLLEPVMLRPGASATGLKFFSMDKLIADWTKLEIEASYLKKPPQLPFIRVGAHFTEGELQVEKTSLPLKTKDLTISRCGFDRKSKHFSMSFSNDYGRNGSARSLSITIAQNKLPEPGKTYTFTPNNSDQLTEFFLGSDHGLLNGAWRSSMPANTPTKCTFVPNYVRDGIKWGHLEEHFVVSGRLSCEGLADWDYSKTQTALKFSADLGCYGKLL